MAGSAVAAGASSSIACLCAQAYTEPMNTPVIPLIDLSPFRDGGDPDVAASIDQACREVGFLLVSGHGVPDGCTAALRQQASAFFASADANKLAVRRPRDDQNRGYIPYGEETLARMHGGVTPPDYKEVFAIGPDDVPEDDYHTGPAAYPSFAPNLWPSEPAGLKAAMLAYFEAMEALMRLLARAFALALNLPPDHFAPTLDRHTSQLRLLHYPAPARDQIMQPGQLRCGEHTDLGMMTILHNESVPGGLQVKARGQRGGASSEANGQGEWIDVPAIDGTFVVNLGDMMMRWTNDRWWSTPHRVAVPDAQDRPRSERLSIGYFVGPNYDALIRCLPTCRDAQGETRYPPITVHDYRTGRFAAGAGLQAGKDR